MEKQRAVTDGMEAIAYRMFKKTFDLTRPTPARPLSEASSPRACVDARRGEAEGHDASFHGQGHGERSEAYFILYVEPPSDAKAKLEGLFNIPLPH